MLGGAGTVVSFPLVEAGLVSLVVSTSMELSSAVIEGRGCTTGVPSADVAPSVGFPCFFSVQIRQFSFSQTFTQAEGTICEDRKYDMRRPINEQGHTPNDNTPLPLLPCPLEALVRLLLQLREQLVLPFCEERGVFGEDGAFDEFLWAVGRGVRVSKQNSRG